jgi:hypothetical protein
MRREEMEIPSSREEAEAERRGHEAWFEDFQQRQAHLPNVTHRIAFLNGWLLAQPAEEEEE